MAVLRTLLSCVLLVGPACSDYGLGELKDDGEPGDTSARDPFHGELEDTEALCGTDDSLTREVVWDESCVTGQETGTLDAVVEWEMNTLYNYGEYNQILMAPMVGQLSDDDGDGDADHADIPDIVVITDDDGVHQHRRGVLRVFSGDGSGAWLTFEKGETETLQLYPYRYSNVALGDVDGDGAADIVFMVDAFEVSTGGPDDTGDSGGSGVDTGLPSGGDDTAAPPDDTGGWDDHPVEPRAPMNGGDECHVAAITPFGGVLWVAMDATLDCGGHAPALADLEGDGEVEVIVGNTVLDGVTGVVRFQGELGEGRTWAYPEIGLLGAVADLDGDGLQEVIGGNTLYAFDGTVECQAATVDGFNAVADFDGDDLGDVVVVGDGQVAVYDHDCAVMAQWSLAGSGNGGPPTVADFDADGTPEIGVADAWTYAVYEADGTALWSMPVTDESSHATGSVVFDFEGDGYPEVVYADETRLWVFDGASGTVRLEDDAHASRTLHDFPTVADVDGDGSSEIVVPNGGGHQGEDIDGLYVLGSADGGWSGSREVWNQHAYSITNVDDDMGIPAVPLPNWPDHNNFRSGDLAPVNGGRSPDAVPLAEACTLECSSALVQVIVRVGNSGAGVLRSGLPVSVYAQDGAWPTLLATAFTDRIVVPGAVSDAIVLDVDASQIVDGLLVVVVDDDDGIGYVRECSELNNDLELEDVTCD